MGRLRCHAGTKIFLYSRSSKRKLIPAFSLFSLLFVLLLYFLTNFLFFNTGLLSSRWNATPSRWVRGWKADAGRSKTLCDERDETLLGETRSCSLFIYSYHFSFLAGQFFNMYIQTCNEERSEDSSECGCHWHPLPSSSNSHHEMANQDPKLCLQMYHSFSPLPPFLYN